MARVHNVKISSNFVITESAQTYMVRYTMTIQN